MKKRRGKSVWPAGILVCCLCCIPMGCGAGIRAGGSGQENMENTAENAQERAGAGEDQAASMTAEEIAKGLESPRQPRFKMEDVRGISVVEKGEILYQINYIPQAGKESYLYWNMPEPYGSAVIVDTEMMYGLYEQIAALDLTAAYEQDGKNGSTEDAASDTYILVNYYQSSDGKEQLTEPDSTVTLLIGEPADGKYQCSLKCDTGRTLLFDTPVIDSILRQNPYDLILKIPYVAAMDTVKEIDIIYQGKQYQLTADGENYQIQGRQADYEEYRSLYSELMQPMLDGELPKDWKTEKEWEPVISLRYIRNLDGAEDYEVKIYPYEKERYTVSVNGEEHFFLAASDVEHLKKVLEEVF